MAASSNISVPTQITDQQQGPLVKIFAALWLSIATIVLATRLLVRWPWRRLFGLDDYAATAATIIALAQWIVVIKASSQGLGTTMELLSDETALRANKLVYAGDLLYVCVLFVSKLSVCLFFRRLSGSTRKTFLADVITYACAGFGIVSLFTIGLRNRVLDLWEQSPDLSNSTFHRWVSVEVLAIFIDLAIVVYPFKLVWGLHMQRSMKSWVLIGFAIRLPLIPLSALRLKNLAVSLTSDEYLFDTATTECYTQAEMTFSRIVATIPCLRTFMEASRTGLLGMNMWDAGTTADSRSRTGKGSAIRSRTKSFVPGARQGEESIQLQDWGQSSARAQATASKNSIASDSSEKAIIVRQTVDVRYD